MGLDNGITRVDISKGKDIYGLFNEEKDICYWRKWWGFRDSVISMLKRKNKDMDNRDEIELDDSDLEDIMYILESLDKESWYSPIWDWEDVKDQVPLDIKNIKDFIEEKKGKTNIKAIFYDSY